jgi:acetylornithine deacetylase/succinyl-diaminopimelate desuccinylase-like protein
MAPSELQTIHGNNERISVEGVEKGAVILTQLLIDFTSD